MSKTHVFPHIIRIFSAAILWGGLVGLFFVNFALMPHPATQVLGVNTEAAQAEYVFWKGVIIEKPDYRDAHLALASAAYQLSNLAEAKKHLLLAINLDPNNLVISSLLEALKEVPLE